MSTDPPDYLANPTGTITSYSYSYNNNPLLIPLDGSYVQEILFNFQDNTSYLSNDNSKSFVGMVYGMCTQKEHQQKVQMNTANDLERDSHKNVNPKLTLKSFQRSDAFRTFKPEDVRPSIWCRRTVYYALCYFVDADIVKKPYLMDKNFTFLDIYNFLRDRFRSIWQDLTVQRCTRHRGYIECFEISIRFLIYSNEVLCESEEYDVAQNILLLNTCLDKLMDGYSDVRTTVDKVTPSEAISQRIRNDPNFTLIMNVLTYVSPHEAEFWSYRLLLLIPQILTPGCSATFCDIIQRMPPQIKNSPFVKFSISACLSASSGNICSYFKLMNSKDCHPLQAALMNRFSGCIRVRFLHNILVNKIVKDGTNPFNFETLKTLLGYEGEPDDKFISFLSRYYVKASRSDSVLSLDGAKLDKLIQDNNTLGKIAGKTQMTSCTVKEKFSTFKQRQLIFDPDFRAPNISLDSQQPNLTAQFGVVPSNTFNNTHNIFNTTTPQTLTSALNESKSKPILLRTDTFGATSSDVFAPLSAPTSTSNVMGPSDPHTSHFPQTDIFRTDLNTSHQFGQQEQQNHFQLSVHVQPEVRHIPKFIKTNEKRRVKIYIPKLNEELSDLYFTDRNLDNITSLRKLAKTISSKVLSNDDKDVVEPVKERNVQPEEELKGCESPIKYCFDKFEYETTTNMYIKNRKNYYYLNLNASLHYLESELNRYLNHKASKWVIYSMYLCTKCSKSKIRTQKILIRLIRKFIRTKTSLTAFFKNSTENLRSTFSHNISSAEIKSDRFKRSVSDVYNIISSRNFNFKSLKSYFENKIHTLLPSKSDVNNEYYNLSPLSSILSITYNNMETLIKNSRDIIDGMNLPDCANVSDWGSGIFVHISFFDFSRNNCRNYVSESMGTGLLHFKDHVKGYMRSDYCTNLKLDILRICGFSVKKEDLIIDKQESEGCVRHMFQIMSCKIPYMGESNNRNTDMPFSINVSLELKDTQSLSRVRYTHHFNILSTPINNSQNSSLGNTELTNVKHPTRDGNINTVVIASNNIDPDINLNNNNNDPNIAETKLEDNTSKNKTIDNNTLTEINRSIILNGDVYTSAIDKNDPRYQNHPQIVIFACSRTLKLGDEDIFCKLRSKKKIKRLKFNDKLPVVDSLALLSYLINNIQSQNSLSPGVSCIVCYRLSLSKIDILKVFNSCVIPENNCKCKNRSFKKVKSLISMVNRSLMRSLVDNAIAFNVFDPEILKKLVEFACVGFEFENNERFNQGVNDKYIGYGETSNVEVTRFLYPEGLRRSFESMCHHLVVSGRIKILQKPVELPDLHTFLINLIFFNNITMIEMETNPNGILSNALQRFIVTVIVCFPEGLWDLHTAKYKECTQRTKRKRGLIEGDNDRQLTCEYSKNSLVAMLMSLKEHIKQTDHSMEVEEGGGSDVIIGYNDALEQNELFVIELSKYIGKVLECFKIRKFMVPYAVAEYIINLNISG